MTTLRELVASVLHDEYCNDSCAACRLTNQVPDWLLDVPLERLAELPGLADKWEDKGYLSASVRVGEARLRCAAELRAFINGRYYMNPKIGEKCEAANRPHDKPARRGMYP